MNGQPASNRWVQNGETRQVTHGKRTLAETHNKLVPLAQTNARMQPVQRTIEREGEREGKREGRGEGGRAALGLGGRDSRERRGFRHKPTDTVRTQQTGGPRARRRRRRRSWTSQRSCCSAAKMDPGTATLPLLPAGVRPQAGVTVQRRAAPLTPRQSIQDPLILARRRPSGR